MKQSILIKIFLIFLSILFIFNNSEGSESQHNDYFLNKESLFSSERIIENIRFLSSEQFMGRGIGTEGIDKAAEFIAKKFRDAGLKPAGDTKVSFFQTWFDTENNVKMKNVIGVIPGRNPILSEQNIVIGAHYDHLGVNDTGNFYPGADDNASGISVLLELSEFLSKNLIPDRNIVFIAFTGEENDRKGSKYYLANYKRYPATKCIGMINLDTIGRLRENKLFVIGANSAKEWMDILETICNKINLQIEVVAEEINSSDQVSFHEKGIPAIQLFTGPHVDYHRTTDTADKINLEGLLKIAYVAKEIIEYLAQKENPLEATLKQISPETYLNKKERKVGIGIIPDFSYKLKGVRLDGVIPGSPAELCGMKKGDIIIKINNNSVNNLKELSFNLKSINAGEKISITYIRDGEEKTIETYVIQR